MAANLRHATGADVRVACRNNEWTSPTAGLAMGFVQANLVILPKEQAFDFLLFCQRNPKPCPLLDVTEPGDPVTHSIAPTADLKTGVNKINRMFNQNPLTADNMKKVEQDR